MRSTPELDARAGLTKLAGYPYQIATWVDDDGYPVSVAVEATIAPDQGVASFAAPAGLTVPTDREVSLTGSHIRPQPGYGYDERRHVTVWGRVTTGIRPDAMEPVLTLAGRSAWGWDEAETPFFEYSERSVPRSRRYFDALSAERGTPVRPRLSFGFLALRSTRLPFLTATIVPVVLGIAIAASHGAFDLWAAALTVIGAAFVQLGLNVANDVFDTVQGADDANVTPTQFSGGSRVIQYGLVSLRQMATLATVFYVLAGLIGLVLLATRGSTALLVIGVVGFIVSPLMAQCSADLLPSQDFARRPLVWLDLIARNRGTISYSPSFGYEICVRRAERVSDLSLDLSSWRAAGPCPRSSPGCG